MRGLRPSDRFPGKLLWEVRDSDEKVSQVSRISMVFNRLKLVGIVCGYGQGLAQRSVGRTDGERQTMTLYDGELPCRFDFLLYGDEHAIVVSSPLLNAAIASDAPDTHCLQMYTDHNRKQAFFPSGSSPSLWEKPSEYFATRMLDGSSNSEGFDPNPQLKQPVSCVGIWVTMRIHEIGGKDIWDLGPLLLDAEYEEMNFARDMEQDEESR